MRLLVIDNYDSFTHNLVQLFSTFELDVLVARHDAITLPEIARLKPDGICLSPGPRAPQQAGITLAVIRAFHTTLPLFGVCLGMQAINEAFGGKTVLAPTPWHGKRDRIFHQGEGLFRGLPSPFWGARYHSLQIEGISADFKILATSSDGVIMGIQHRAYPLCGVQYHPESFLSECGPALVENFLEMMRDRVCV